MARPLLPSPPPLPLLLLLVLLVLLADRGSCSSDDIANYEGSHYNTNWRQVLKRIFPLWKPIRQLQEENQALRAENLQLLQQQQQQQKRNDKRKRDELGENPQEDGDLMQLAESLSSEDDDMDDEHSDAGGEGGCFPRNSPLRRCNSVKRVFALQLDDEAEALCDNHQLCVACSGVYGIPSNACDAAYLKVASEACLAEAASDGGSGIEECGAEANLLLRSMRQLHSPAEPIAATIIGCHRACVARIFTGMP